MTELPKGWARATIGELIAGDGLFVDGDWVESKDQDPAGDVRLTQLADVGDGSWRNRSGRLMTSAAAERLRCTLLEVGDVLVARMPAPLGRACLFPGDALPCVSVVDVAVVRPGSRSVCPDWLMWAINSPGTRAAIEAQQAGTTRKRISRKNLGAIALPVPPVVEQERIVAAVEEAFSNLDAGEAGLRTVRQLLKRMRVAILAAAVTGRLVPRDPTDPPVAAREDWTSSKEDPFSDGELPELPNRWRWTRAASACEGVECGGTPPAQHMSQGAGDVPFIKVYNLTLTGALDFSVNPTFIDAATHARQRRSWAQPGDVLTNIVGPPLGKVAVVPPTYPSWNMNQAVVMFRPGESLVAGYLAIALQSSAVIDRLSRTARATAGQFNVSLTACRYLPLPLPPLPEQHRIVDEVARQLSVVEACGRALEVGAERSAALRRSVLKAAFEGKLVPQNPSEEPASVLLERIREEQAAAPKEARRSRRTA